jgi:hypothetical protein
MIPALTWRLLNEEKFLVRNLPGCAPARPCIMTTAGMRCECDPSDLKT